MENYEVPREVDNIMVNQQKLDAILMKTLRFVGNI